MKYLKKFSLFESVSELSVSQRAFLINGTLSGGTWSLNPETGLVDVDGDFMVGKTAITVLPVSFGVVTGNFIFEEFKTGFISLKGSPIEVGGDFDCSNNKLTSLEGAPRKVGGSFNCFNNKLTSLRGAPIEVGGDFDCSNNKLTSLEGANKLTSLEGAPWKVGGSFDCSNNKLTSLEGAPRKVGGSFVCTRNKLTSLEGAPLNVGGVFYCKYNPLTSLEGAPLKIGERFIYHNILSGIKWNMEGWLNGMRQNRKLFLPLIAKIDHRDLSPEDLNLIRKEFPKIFKILAKRFGDGTTAAADLGDLGF
jgi:hypothetical protein